MADSIQRKVVVSSSDGKRRILCAVRTNGAMEAKEFLESAQCRVYLPAILAYFKAIVDCGEDDDDVSPKPLTKTRIREVVKGQVRIFCFRDGADWILTHGDLKKTRRTPRWNIERADKIMEEDLAR